MTKKTELGISVTILLPTILLSFAYLVACFAY